MRFNKLYGFIWFGDCKFATTKLSFTYNMRPIKILVENNHTVYTKALFSGRQKQPTKPRSEITNQNCMVSNDCKNVLNWLKFLFHFIVFLWLSGVLCWNFKCFTWNSIETPVTRSFFQLLPIIFLIITFCFKPFALLIWISIWYLCSV